MSLPRPFQAPLSLLSLSLYIPARGKTNPAPPLLDLVLEVGQGGAALPPTHAQPLPFPSGTFHFASVAAGTPLTLSEESGHSSLSTRATSPLSPCCRYSCRGKSHMCSHNVAMAVLASLMSLSHLLPPLNTSSGDLPLPGNCDSSLFGALCCALPPSQGTTEGQTGPWAAWGESGWASIPPSPSFPLPGRRRKTSGQIFL